MTIRSATQSYRFPLSPISSHSETKYKEKHENDMTGRTTAFRNKDPIYDMFFFSAAESSGHQAVAALSALCHHRFGAAHNLLSTFEMFFFQGAVFGAGLNVVPGNVNVSTTRTRCPNAVLLVASQGAPVVY